MAWSASKAPRPAPRKGASLASPASGAPFTILVAEDEDSLRGMLDLVLRGRGYEVVLCADGAVARDTLAGDRRLDAALFDLRMPGVSGTELLKQLRDDPRRAGTPAVAMSAYSDDHQALAMLAAGADAFLAKPFTIQELTATLDTLLQDRAASR